MAGVFIVSIPQKNHEELLKKNKSTNLVFEKEKYENASKLIHELKGNRMFGSRSLEPFTEDNSIAKSKSTDSLNSITSANLYKSKSDNNLNVTGVDGRNKKRSWDDFKQSIKPNFKSRNKLKITGERSNDILGDIHCNTPLETILSETIARFSIHNSSWSSTKNKTHWQVVFTVESNLCEELVQVLRAFGVGSRHQSSVSVLSCALHYADKHDATTTKEIENGSNEPDPVWSCFSSPPGSNMRQRVKEAYADAGLTCQWLCLLLAAAFLATIGLMENSAITIVASMLISPLMGPITAVTLGTVVQDRYLQHTGFMHTMLGLFLCMATGFIVGLLICILDERYGIVGDWPSPEMISRCELRSLWIGILIALPSGACGALSAFGQSTASLVSVVFSASILPAAVNAGLLWAMALDRLLSSNEDLVWSVLNPGALATLGTVSLCLTVINTLAVFLAGVAVYKIKQVCPIEQKEISWWRRNCNQMKLSTVGQHFEESTISSLNNEQCTEVPEAMPEKKLPGLGIPGSVQSDTVTYRRPGFHRLRAQNIETYCLSKTQFDDKYTSLSSQQPAIVHDNIGESPDKLIIPVNEDLQNGRKNSFSFYNWAYQEHQGNEQRPTLEPSLNFTVSSKTPHNCGIALNTKTFEV